MDHCKWGRISWGSGDVTQPLQHFPRYLLWLTTGELSGERLSQGDSSCVMCSVLGNFLMSTVTSGVKHRDLNPTSPSATVPKGPGEISNAKGNPNSTKAPTLSPALCCHSSTWWVSLGSVPGICPRDQHEPEPSFATAPCCAQVRASAPVWEAPSHLSLRIALSCQNNPIPLHWEGREGAVCECPTVSHHPSL